MMTKTSQCAQNRCVSSFLRIIYRIGTHAPYVGCSRLPDCKGLSTSSSSNAVLTYEGDDSPSLVVAKEWHTTTKESERRVQSSNGRTLRCQTVLIL
jgi:hypothetical protein